MKKRQGHRWWRTHSRDYDDPVYKKWRTDIFKRDGFTCQWPGCSSNKKLNAHHIQRWTDNAHIRFNLGNGITLCKKCHDRVHGKEIEYAPLFYKILMNNNGKK